MSDITSDNTVKNEVPQTPEIDSSSQIQSHVETTMEAYFENLDGHSSHSVYDMVISEAEQPLLRVVLKHTRGNQTRAAEILGINRGTLRKKLNLYNLG